MTNTGKKNLLTDAKGDVSPSPDVAILLEKLYARYNHRRYVATDPLRFVYDYRRKTDREIVALLCACLAYGRVTQIQNSLADLLARIGPDPFSFVRSLGRRQRRMLHTFKHRFTSGRDIADLLAALQGPLRRFGGLEGLFAFCQRPGDCDVSPALSRFSRLILACHASANDGKTPRTLGYLLCDPAAGSACKRLNLFLRWMVRKDNVDPGLWKSVDAAKLIVPMDTHMTRLCRILGLMDGKSASLSAALQVSRRFARIAPGDPVRYDFALSRVGIVEKCNGRYRPGCELCELAACCVKKIPTHVLENNRPNG